ncbi:MAG: bifunctional 4-hydroxy-2-oxoglutarate aldolase/2-dehydro-3-deoxy-phosphogluconate aldolase, partial [Candidatus Kryptoniota bacterium]
AMKGPMPEIRLMPTGGVTVDNAADWIRAGASAVAMGGDLLDMRAIQDKRWNILTERAKRLVESCLSINKEG